MARQILVQNGGKRGRPQCLLTCSVQEISDIIEDKNFFVDEDKEKNKLFRDDNEITSPDLDEPNFNEMKELKSSIKYTYSWTL